MGNWYLLNMQHRKWRKLNNSWCIGLSWLCLTAAQFHFLFDILSSHPTYLPHFNHFLRPPPHPPRFWTFGRYQWKLPKIVTAWGRFRTMILTGRFSPRSKHPELSRIAPCIAHHSEKVMNAKAKAFSAHAWNTWSPSYNDATKMKGCRTGNRILDQEKYGSFSARIS